MIKERRGRAATGAVGSQERRGGPRGVKAPEKKEAWRRECPVFSLASFEEAAPAE